MAWWDQFPYTRMAGCMMLGLGIRSKFQIGHKIIPLNKYSNFEAGFHCALKLSVCQGPHQTTWCWPHCEAWDWTQYGPRDHTKVSNWLWCSPRVETSKQLIVSSSLGTPSESQTSSLHSWDWDWQSAGSLSSDHTRASWRLWYGPGAETDNWLSVSVLELQRAGSKFQWGPKAGTNN